MNLRDTSTPEGKAIWDAVDKAAERVPEWMKPRIEEIAAKVATKLNAKQPEAV